MEGASGVSVIPARNLGWIDVGSWDSLKTLLQGDQDGNVIKAVKSVAIDTRNSYIQTTDKDRVVAVIGLEDIFIIEHENALLVCKKGQSQKVKEIIAFIKNNDLGQFL
jgi:mannose-1-phosphate guanylyltransferase